MPKSKFVSDGPSRYAIANREKLRKEIEAKYSDQLATAGLLRRLAIRCAVFWELRKRSQHSPYTLWYRK
jgi:hypothetical protein